VPGEDVQRLMTELLNTPPDIVATLKAMTDADQPG
jgi:hypothetical protein